MTNDELLAANPAELTPELQKQRQQIERYRAAKQQTAGKQAPPNEDDRLAAGYKKNLLGEGGGLSAAYDIGPTPKPGQPSEAVLAEADKIRREGFMGMGGGEPSFKAQPTAAELAVNAPKAPGISMGAGSQSPAQPPATMTAGGAQHPYAAESAARLAEFQSSPMMQNLRAQSNARMRGQPAPRVAQPPVSAPGQGTAAAKRPEKKRTA
jgi:hypothetical protein